MSFQVLMYDLFGNGNVCGVKKTPTAKLEAPGLLQEWMALAMLPVMHTLLQMIPKLAILVLVHFKIMGTVITIGTPEKG